MVAAGASPPPPSPHNFKMHCASPPPHKPVDTMVCPQPPCLKSSYATAVCCSRAVIMQEEGGQGLRFVSRPFKSSELTHTYTVCAAILNNNYYITTIHLTHRHELMGEGVFFFNWAAQSCPRLVKIWNNMKSVTNSH